MATKFENGNTVPTTGELAQNIIESGHIRYPDSSAADVTAGEGNEVIETPRGSQGESHGSGNDTETRGGNVATTPGVDSSMNGDNGGANPYADNLAGIDAQIKTLDDIMKRLNAPEDEETRKKRERRERSKRIISAVSDGLSALGNLYYTSQYAPDMYEGRNSLTGATNAMIERARAEREKNDEAYFNFAMKRGQLAHERAKTAREIEVEQEKLALARQKAERDAEKHQWLASLQPDIQREQAGKSARAESQAITAQYEAAFAPEMQQAKLNTENARTEAQRASATASRASANASNASAARSRAEAGAVNQFYAWDENGNEHKFKTKAAAEAYAKQHGTYQEMDIEETSETNSDVNGRSTTSRKKKGGHAAKPSPTGKPSPTA